MPLERSIAKESELCATELDGALPHGGNSCAAVQNSYGSNVLYDRSYSFWRKEVEWYSSLQILRWRLSFSRNLKIGHEIGASLWSRWKRNWRRCSLELHRSTTLKHFPETWREQFLDTDWLQHIYHGSSKMRFPPVLHEFSKFLIVYSCHSRTHWWEFDSAWVDGSRRNSIQKARVLVSPRMLV